MVFIWWKNLSLDHRIKKKKVASYFKGTYPKLLIFLDWPKLQWHCENLVG